MILYKFIEFIGINFNAYRTFLLRCCFPRYKKSLKIFDIIKIMFLFVTILRRMHTAYLSLGSNLGDRYRYINKAVDRIGERAGNIVMRSSFYQTPPWGFDAEKAFINIALKIETSLPPYQLLKCLQTIEAEMGRKRNSKGYSSRNIDIDILFFDNLIIADEELTVPHRFIPERNFVLAPMDEIAPSLVHPVLQQSIRKIYQNSPDTSTAILVPGSPVKA